MRSFFMNTKPINFWPTFGFEEYRRKSKSAWNFTHYGSLGLVSPLHKKSIFTFEPTQYDSVSRTLQEVDLGLVTDNMAIEYLVGHLDDGLGEGLRVYVSPHLVDCNDFEIGSKYDLGKILHLYRAEPKSEIVFLTRFGKNLGNLEALRLANGFNPKPILTKNSLATKLT